MPKTPPNVSKDMQFFYELKGDYFTVYERSDNMSTRTQSDLKEVLTPLGQVRLRGSLEKALQEVFKRVEFEPAPDNFSLTNLFTQNHFVGKYNPAKNKVENLTDYSL